jgi:hypothetical protein
MPIRTEFYVVCDECHIYLGEDRGDSDDLFSTRDEAVGFAEDNGWSVRGRHVRCAGCVNDPLPSRQPKEITP